LAERLIFYGGPKDGHDVHWDQSAPAEVSFPDGSIDRGGPPGDRGVHVYRRVSELDGIAVYRWDHWEPLGKRGRKR
jgi:hypothetical protein